VIADNPFFSIRNSCILPRTINTEYMTEIKTVRLHPNTHMRLQLCGRFGESYDTLINRLIDEHEQVSETKNKYRSQQATTNETGTQPIEVQ